MISVLRFKYFYTSIFLIIGLTLWLTYPRYYEFSGPIFGTYYKVILVGPKYAINESKVKASIQDYLQSFDMVFSTYRNDSELMTLNLAPINTKIELSASLYSVIELAQELQLKIGPEWDPTIVPISQSFGFMTLPKQSTLTVGLKHLELLSLNTVRKNANIALDLSSIAKGAAVDGLSSLVNHLNIKGAYVDIGGEIKTTGKKTKNLPWGIGIQSPENRQSITHIIYASNIAIATSGNYLNVNNVNGVKIGHILDPVSKSAINHDLLSVSIIAKKCAVADAIATGIFVMGPEKAMSWLKANNDVPALLILKNGDEEKSVFMNGFDRFLDPVNNSFF